MFKDGLYISAEDKKKILNDWIIFLQSGCDKSKFTKKIYNFLVSGFGFLPYYNINLFYDDRFARIDDLGIFATFDQIMSISNGSKLDCAETDDCFDLRMAISVEAMLHWPNIKQNIESLTNNGISALVCKNDKELSKNQCC